MKENSLKDVALEASKYNAELVVDDVKYVSITTGEQSAWITGVLKKMYCLMIEKLSSSPNFSENFRRHIKMLF